ncbi:EamA family transporter RarD [Shimia biformata]|uniref:EamA family transporter RarD n=1 Tax=Shimia biformata TaxID=1294299 RepID=UPI001951A1D8|nr:EamA family transporter RarD [Shimia biformata]
MTDTQKGILALVAACTIWGLAPLYWKLLAHIPAPEVLAHRTFWSAVTFGGLIAVQGRIAEFARALGQGRQVLVILIAALLISFNWGLFIWSIATGQATEASLGYFLFPLVAVLAGRLLFGEKLPRAQWASVLLAGFAVLLLAVGLGAAPWIALSLSISFGFYGVVKKGLSLGPVLSVTGEVVLLAPLAILYLVAVSGISVDSYPMRDWAILFTTGVVTATPLVLFSYAARRVRLATVGLVQYINPSLQFFCALVIFAEPFGIWHMIAFPLIWLALAVYSWSAWREDRRARQAKARRSLASSASTSATT